MEDEKGRNQPKVDRDRTKDLCQNLPPKANSFIGILVGEAQPKPQRGKG